MREKTKFISFRVSEAEFDSIQKFVDTNGLGLKRSEIIIEALKSYGAL